MPEPGPPAGWSRRDVLRMGVAAAVVAGAASPAAGAEPGHEEAPMLRTPLCDLLGIEHPVLQAPMPDVSTPEMVAAVGEAGGFGFLAGTALPPGELRRQIRRVRELTDRPFGANLLLHPGITRPADPESVPDDVLRRAQAVLDRFRGRLGLPPAAGRPPRVPATSHASFEVILEERVPVFGIGLGTPPDGWVERCRERGIRVVAMAATVDGARELAAAGVDAIVAQGSEAGGHRSTWTRPADPQRADPQRALVGTLALVPQVVDAVRVPVIAAGAVTDGRQLLAALMLGADGVLMGTRFIATRESGAPEPWRRAVVGGDSDATVVTDVFTGLPARVLRNAFVEEYHASGAPALPPLVQLVATGDIRAAARERGLADYLPLYAGQGIGLIRDVPGAGTVVGTVVREAEAALREFPRRVSTTRS